MTTSLPTAIEEYLLSCQAENLSPRTIAWYASTLRAFQAALPTANLASVTPTMIRQYIVALQTRNTRYPDAPQKPPQPGGLSTASIASHVRALHAFWSWATSEYALPANPMTNIKRHRNPPPEPKAISPADVIRLLNATTDTRAGTRDRALLVFLADTGCRLGGLLSLTLGNLALDNRSAFLWEKGNKLRKVVFTAYTSELLKQWLALRQSPTDSVFTSVITSQPLTPSGVHQLLRRLKTRARVTGRVNPHSFRHNFAREYLRKGGDLATLARLLGHADISTTAAYYAVFSDDELADFHEKLSPIHGMIVRKEHIE
jgi:integrase/recombinase XerD